MLDRESVKVSDDGLGHSAGCYCDITDHMRVRTELSSFLSPPASHSQVSSSRSHTLWRVQSLLWLELRRCGWKRCLCTARCFCGIFWPRNVTNISLRFEISYLLSFLYTSLHSILQQSIGRINTTNSHSYCSVVPNPPVTRIQCSTLAGRPECGMAAVGPERWRGSKSAPPPPLSGRSPSARSAASWSAGLLHRSDCMTPSLLLPSCGGRGTRWSCTNKRYGWQDKSSNWTRFVQAKLSLCYQEANHMSELLIRRANHRLTF